MTTTTTTTANCEKHRLEAVLMTEDEWDRLLSGDSQIDSCKIAVKEMPQLGFLIAQYNGDELQLDFATDFATLIEKYGE